MALIISGLLLLFGCSVVSASVHLQCPRDVEARPGLNVTLQFSMTPYMDTNWTFHLVVNGANVMVHRYGTRDTNSENKMFNADVFFNETSNIIFVTLYNVNANYSGIYTFSVNTGGKLISCSLNLTVREQPDVKPANIKQLNQQGDNGTLGSDKQGNNRNGTDTDTDNGTDNDNGTDTDNDNDNDNDNGTDNGTVIGTVIGIIVGIIVVVIIAAIVIWRYMRKAPEIPVTGEEMAELRGNKETPAEGAV